MLSRTSLERPRRDAPIEYVYIKMLQAQADTQEGKLVKGQVLSIPKDKATRWCFRARIARPATREEYDKYQARMEMIAARSGQGVRPRLRRGVAIPEEDPFTYVQSDEVGFDGPDMEDDEDLELTGGEPTLSDRLGDLVDDDDEFDPDEQPESPPQPGVYNEAILTGPGQNPEDRPRARARGRGARTNQDNGPETDES